MSNRLFAHRLLALTLAYVVALQGLLPSFVVTDAIANSVICVTSGSDQAPREPAKIGKECPCVAGCAVVCCSAAPPGAFATDEAFGLADAGSALPLLAILAAVAPHRGMAPNSARAPPAA